MFKTSNIRGYETWKVFFYSFGFLESLTILSLFMKRDEFIENVNWKPHRTGCNMPISNEMLFLPIYYLRSDMIVYLISAHNASGCSETQNPDVPHITGKTVYNVAVHYQ